MSSISLRRTTSLLLAAALLGSACGSSSGDSPDGSSATDGIARPASLEVAVPDLQVHDLQAGGEKPLRSLLGGEQPILFWFWAPH